MKDWQKQINILLQICHELVADLHADSQWTKEHDKKLTRLGKIAGVLQKVQKIVVEAGPEEHAISPAEDDEIIKQFLARQQSKSYEKQ